MTSSPWPGALSSAITSGSYPLFPGLEVTGSNPVPPTSPARDAGPLPRSPQNPRLPKWWPRVLFFTGFSCSSSQPAQPMRAAAGSPPRFLLHRLPKRGFAAEGRLPQPDAFSREDQMTNARSVGAGARSVACYGQFVPWDDRFVPFGG
jgi:hypothetical protein